ncbi:MAG: hypothetical protein RMJ00_01165 [Nitrososphaerota archaeon]|nr:hypothetical protein [Candidatus Bathyarchaeota archaeon]MCX8162800.1 hypothetical protein [Candidatus Bathyarchaeota archaeon]MDW8061297.1 hypothetical protein [Nitrososphaerota archaeon]
MHPSRYPSISLQKYRWEVESKLENLDSLYRIQYDVIESDSTKVHATYLDGQAILPGKSNRFKVSVGNLIASVSVRVKV